MLPIDRELTEYLTKILMDDNYNKWFLDCRVNQATHSIVSFGIFVCEDCAQKHVDLFGRSQTWPKKVLVEMWDDYQLMHIAKGCGGNKPLYMLFQEYALENCTHRDKYTSKVFQWYRAKHLALVDGVEFSEPKPEKKFRQFFIDAKEKVKDKARRASFKSACLAHRADQRLLKSNTLGRMWKKIRKHDDEQVNCNCTVCVERQAQKDAFEMAKKQGKTDLVDPEMIDFGSEEEDFAEDENILDAASAAQVEQQ